MEAIEAKIITSDISRKQVSWGFGTKHPIITAPVGISPLDHMVDYTFEDDGQDVFKKIKSKLNGEPLKVEKTEKVNLKSNKEKEVSELE